MKVIGFALIVIGAATNQAYIANYGYGLLAAGSYLDARKARRRARDAYNASLQDRLEMVDVQPDAARTFVLGRVRAVEGVRRRWTSGANDEKLTLVVSFAGHEIDAFEKFYADDIELTLDGSGYVQTEPFAKTSIVSVDQGGTLDGTGAAAPTLGSTPVSGSVTAIWHSGSGDSYISGSLTVGGSGTSITLSGGLAGADYTVNYQTTSVTHRMRIRPYLGTAAQNVGSDLAAEYPGKITSADKFTSIALAVVDLDYDPDVFPQGVPRITALMRGAKVLDPRTGTTAWSENPALLAYHYARHSNGWALAVGDIRTADIQAAADVCDVSTDFTLRKSPTVTEVVTLPRYRCGITIPTDGDPRAAMDDIFETMAGRWGWAGGTWRMRAGALGSTAWDLQPNWVAQRLGPDGLPADGSAVVQWTSGVPRENKVNRVTGRCVDPSQRWQVLPFPAVEDATLIATEGAEYATEVEYLGVNHVAHAQHLGTVRIRQAQASLRGELQCNLTAYPLELWDVGTVTLPRYGMAGKTFEVVGWRWHPAEGVRLTLEEITADIFTPVAELTGRDPAPNSGLPSPWSVETITGVAVTSGTVTLTDASVLTRTQVSWDAAVSEAVRVGGRIEVQYALADDAPATDDWASWPEQGSATVAVIPGLLAERWYVFRVRAVSALGVRGAWSAQVLHQVAAPPAGAAGPQGDSVIVEYSIDGATLWHGTFTTGDLYARWKIGDAGAWNGPFRIVGETGVGGDYLDFVFKRSATQPATPTGDSPAGWSDAPPAADGNPLWASTGNKTAAGTLIGVWSTPVQIEGAAGDRTAIVYIYRRAASAPALPTTTTTYTFSTNTPTGMNNSWTATIPAVNGNPLYVAAATATAAAGGNTDTIGPGEWATPVILTQDGADGAEGAKSAVVFAYQRTATSSAPTLPSVTATYTFATASLTGLNNGWSATVPASGGAYLWVITATALSTGTSDTITSGEWAAARLMSQDGATGNTGQSNHRVYKAVTIGSPPATPGNTTSGATPAGWSATPLTLTTGQEQYQSDGTTAAGSTTTVWGTPYPSYLKVGSLSAISADLGTITAGAISGTSTISITGSAAFDGVNSALTVQTESGTSSKTAAVRANNSASAAIGVWGKATIASGYGLYGEGTGTNGVGVFGYGPTGVVGKAVSAGRGVAGFAVGAGSTGVYGKTDGNSEDGGLFETGGVGGGASNTALRARANNSAHTALAVEGASTFTGRITSTVAGTNVCMVLPVVSSKPTAIAGGVCLHTSLGLIVSDGANWYGPSGGLVTV